MTPAHSRWTLTARITALCFAIALVLGLIAASAAAVAVDNRRQTARLVDTLSPARVSTDDLLIAMVNQETAVRGYAVSGNPDDLAPYSDGLAQQKDAVSRLNHLVGDRPAMAALIRQAEQQAQQWQATVAQPIIDDVRAGDLNSAQGRVDEAARHRFDDLRTTIDQLASAISVERTATSRGVRAAAAQLVELLVSAAIVVVLAGVLLFFALRMLVTRPIEQLAGDVRVVYSGDFTHEIPSVGAPELAELGTGVDIMRRRILVDLEQVNRARTLLEESRTALERQTEELTRSNRDLEQFAYVASHDLQEPLRKVASFCQLLQRRYAGQLDERADQYIAFAVDGAQRMQRLINDLLAFSRIGRVTSNFVDVDLNQVVATAASHHQQQVEQAGGEITWVDLPVVQGEEALLSALVENLVSNSVKFQRPDTPPRIRLSGRRSGEEWEITCADNGIGIEPEFAEKVFVIFQRLHGKEAYPGTGIGLAVAKKIVEYHGGRIWVDPEAGPGTTIHFTLPVTAVPASVSPAAAQPTEEPVA